MRSLTPNVQPGPRADILDSITRTPGIHLRGLERSTGLPLGQVTYHLDRLERMGIVDSLRDTSYRRSFLARDMGLAEKRVVAALWHDTARRIVERLIATPGMTHKELRDALQVAGSTVTTHLQRLVADGVVLRERVDGALIHRLASPELVNAALSRDAPMKG